MENQMGPRSLHRAFVCCVSFGGVLVLSFLLGAAVMSFNLPTSAYLVDAFRGGEAWSEQQDALAAAPAPTDEAISISVDQPAKTFDGFTLFTTNAGSQARLIDMRGETIH